MCAQRIPLWIGKDRFICFRSAVRQGQRCGRVALRSCVCFATHDTSAAQKNAMRLRQYSRSSASLWLPVAWCLLSGASVDAQGTTITGLQASGAQVASSASPPQGRADSPSPAGSSRLQGAPAPGPQQPQPRTPAPAPSSIERNHDGEPPCLRTSANLPTLLYLSDRGWPLQGGMCSLLYQFRDRTAQALPHRLAINSHCNDPCRGCTQNLPTRLPEHQAIAEPGPARLDGWQRPLPGLDWRQLQ